MLKKILFFAALGTLPFLQACNELRSTKGGKGFKSTKGGLEYKIVDDKEGKPAKLGDMLVLHVLYENAVDTLDTYKHGVPITPVLDSAMAFPGSLEEGLLMLSSGDSAVFRVNNDLLYTRTFGIPLPKELSADGRTTFYVKVDTVYTEEGLAAELDDEIKMVEAYKADLVDTEEFRQKLIKEEQQIIDYLRKNGLKSEKTANGVHIVVKQQGSGNVAAPGDRLEVHYTGTLLDGKVFQRSQDLGAPFEFILGTAQAGLGWNEGLSGLKEGSKALILIPSPLAYGEKGVKDKKGEFSIPPDAPVVFEVEVLGVYKK